MNLAAGQSAVDELIISNGGKKPERLRISAATGRTAPNGGSTFIQAFHRCAGPGCWLAGLPRKITLSAGTEQRLTFKVTVPAASPHGQYLAGIAAEPAVRPRAVIVGANGKATARAVIVDQLVVGVAITVGSPSALTTRLRMPGVTGQAIGQTPRLAISLRNTGQTFAAGTGAVSCEADGKRRSYHVFTGTLLPRDRATIAVNAPGLRSGASVPCTVRLHFGRGQTVRWSGTITIPVLPRTRIVHTGNGAYSVLPVGGIPFWAIVVCILGILILAVLTVLVIRGRRRPPGTGGRSTGRRGKQDRRGATVDHLFGDPPGR